MNGIVLKSRKFKTFSLNGALIDVKLNFQILWPIWRTERVFNYFLNVVASQMEMLTFSYTIRVEFEFEPYQNILPESIRQTRSHVRKLT